VWVYAQAVYHSHIEFIGVRKLRSIRATAPGRAGIIGNPTDGYGGSLVSCSLAERATATIVPAAQLILVNKTGQKVLKWENDFANQGDYFDIVRSVLRYFKLYDLKAKITTETTIPEQAGLAGSTAVIAAVLAAVSTYIGKNYNH